FIVRLGKVPVEVILPEDARVTFVREDESVRQQFVIDDRTVAHDVVVLHKGDGLGRTIPREHSALGEAAETESVTVAQIAQTPAEREVKRADGIVRPRISLIEPIINRAFAVPTFADPIRLETDAAPQRTQFLNRTDHPAAVTFDHVVAESVETDFFQKPAGVADELGIDYGGAMTEVRHVAKGGAVPGLVPARMKAGPVAAEFTASRYELRPARLAVDRIQFPSVSAAVMI